MANIRTRETQATPLRREVHVQRQTPHEDLPTLDDARAYKKKMEGEQLAASSSTRRWRASLWPYADSWLEHRLVRAAADAGHKAGVPGSVARHLHPNSVAPSSARSPRTRPPLACRVEPRLAGPGGQVLPGPPCHPEHRGQRRADHAQPVHHPRSGIEHAPERPCSPRRPSSSSPELSSQTPLPGAPRRIRRIADRGAPRTATARRRPAARHDDRRPPVPRDHGPGRIFTAPKSDAGYRTIALPS